MNCLEINTCVFVGWKRCPPQMRAFVERAAQGLVGLHPKLETTAVERAAALLDAHRRVRTAAGAKGLRYRVDPLLPADVLGLYVYLPA